MVHQLDKAKHNSVAIQRLFHVQKLNIKCFILMAAMLAQTSNSAIDVAIYLRLWLPIKIALIEFLRLYKTEHINKMSRWVGNLIPLIWR